MRFLMCFAALAAFVGCEEQPMHLGKKLSSWVFDLEAKEDFKRQQALEAIAKIGEPAVTTIDKVHPLVNDVHPGVQLAACEALAQLGPKGVGLLEQELQRDEPFSRFFAASALARANPQHEKAVTTLVDTLSGVGNAELSKDAQTVLVRLGEPTVPHILQALAGDYLPVRLEMVQTLGRMEKKAASALPKLVELAKADKESVELRKAALHAMARVGSKDEIKDVYESLLENQPDEVAVNAAVMLRHIGARESPTGFEEE